MGIRESLNKNQTITTIATIALIVIAGIWIVKGMLPDRGPHIAIKSYYTDDDGKTWFEDDASKLVPFDKDGKEVVRAHIFKCGESGEKFIGYLEKLDPKVKQKLEEYMAAHKGRVLPNQDEAEETGRLIKRPGDKNWLPDNNPVAVRITTVKCKDGNYALRVVPEVKE